MWHVSRGFMRILILAPRRHAGHINWSFMRTKGAQLGGWRAGRTRRTGRTGKAGVANKNCLTYPLVDLIKLSQREYIFITLYVSPSYRYRYKYRCRCRCISDVLLRQLPQTPRNWREVLQPAIKIQLVWGNYVRRLSYSTPTENMSFFLLNIYIFCIKIYPSWDNGGSLCIIRPLGNVSWPSDSRQSDKKKNETERQCPERPCLINAQKTLPSPGCEMHIRFLAWYWFLGPAPNVALKGFPAPPPLIILLAKGGIYFLKPIRVSIL